MINITANLLHNIRNGVQIEFILEPRAGEVFSNATNSTENARVDIKGWNVFIRGQLAYFHLNVFNPFARTYGDDSLQKVYEKKTTRKKATLQRAYVTSWSIFSTNGGIEREASTFYLKLRKLAKRKKSWRVKQWHLLEEWWVLLCYEQPIYVYAGIRVIIKVRLTLVNWITCKNQCANN